MASKHVVVTGVSSGIGEAIVKTLCAQGMKVFGSVRKLADAASLLATLGDQFVPLVFDVTDAAAVQTARDHVAARIGKQTLLGLVNNAGFAEAGPLLEQPVADFRRHIEANLIGPLVVTQAFAGMLGAEGGRDGAPGRILNMSSVAGRIGLPFLGAYVASKHGLEGMSETLRRELLVYGIDVILIGPGNVNTPIWDKAEKADLSKYQHSVYHPHLVRFRELVIRGGRLGHTSEHISRVVLQALTTSTPAARYAVVQGPLQNWALPTLLPKRMVDGIFAKVLGLRR